jgi:tRNA nucleotidyltransferase/poly(A) polymerase
MRFYEVGGCVRDELLGVKSKDIDFTVVLEDQDIKCAPSILTPFQIMRSMLMFRGFEIFLETPEFLTIRAKFPKGHKHSGLTADFVLARKESDYTDGRRPDKVEPGTLEDDLRRRDFTMNAIAKDEDGTLIDPFNGQQDIRGKIIRAVGDPTERFEEDALRIVRAMRFAVTKGFSIEAKTLEAMSHLRKNVAGVSAERVREELTKMFNHDPMHTIAILSSHGMFPIIFDMGINFQPTMKQKIK